MKIISAREAKNSFGQFIDMAQREPVVVTKRDRPVGVMFSMDDLSDLINFSDTVKEKINAGILIGLQEAKKGKGITVNDHYLSGLEARVEAKLSC